MSMVSTYCLKVIFLITMATILINKAMIDLEGIIKVYNTSLGQATKKNTMQSIKICMERKITVMNIILRTTFRRQMRNRKRKTKRS